MSTWYRLTAEAALEQLASDPDGLTEAEAASRLSTHGPNALVEVAGKGPWAILWDQLRATMVVILIAAALISAAVGDFKDAVAILAIVIANTFLGFTQEYRAERALAALKRLAVPTVKARREGRLREISAQELVPGDIVILEAGNLVPADGRLLDAANLRIQEAALTGESDAVDKDPAVLQGEHLALGDRKNTVYMGTVITYGRGVAVITETGMRTQLGTIATMIQTVKREPTPLQKRLDQVGRWLALAAVLIVVIVFGLGLLRGDDMRILLLTSISMAVAAVPEGLPAVVTIALALGAQRMLKRRALIRKLPAVETLGSVTVICSDKTGTLTENRMTVTVLEVATGRLEPNGAIATDQPDLAFLLTGLALCNDAVLDSDSHAVGDPTETALAVAAARYGLRKPELESSFPRVGELPFDPGRKRMTTVHLVSPTAFRAVPGLEAQTAGWAAGAPIHIAFTKGAVDGLLSISSSVLVNGSAERLSESWRERIIASNDRLAQSGRRVLGVAFRLLESHLVEVPPEALERDLIFIGVAGMSDPPRPEVKEAVRVCREAGIRPVMITGDHPLTAQQIALELGVADGGRVLTGQDLEQVGVTGLEKIADEVAVYARVSPEHKLNIVEALQSRGHIVAMTGDGVNDAPALKKADIGVAMGITGTDVSKEAADMVLLDDNFATIVKAIEEGRVIYDNIRKFVKYIVTTNSGEIWVMLLAPLLGMPLPLLPLQILWMNLVTDGPLALALSLEPAERGIMQRRPHRPDESIFGRGLGRHIIWVGMLMSLISLGLGYLCWSTNHEGWQTMLFTTLTLSQVAHVLAIRSGDHSLFSIGFFSNGRMVAAVLLTLALHVGVVYHPFLQGFFRTVALRPLDFALAVVLSTVVFWAVELEKWMIRRRAR